MSIDVQQNVANKLIKIDNKLQIKSIAKTYCYKYDNKIKNKM